MDIKANYTGMGDICTSMYNVVNRMKERISTIQEENKSLSNDWQSEASEYYGEELSSLLADFDDAYKELLYAILYIASKSEDYEKLEQTIVKNACKDLNISEPNFSNSKIFSSTM